MRGRFNLYSDRAKRVLALAQDEAREFGRDAIGPEHLLLGVVCAGAGDRKGSGSLGDVLNSLGLDLIQAREAVEALGRGDPKPQLDEIRLSFTPDGEKVIDLATNEAKLLHDETVTPKHLLLAVLREPGRAEGVLQSFGLSSEIVRQQIIVSH